MAGGNKGKPSGVAFRDCAYHDGPVFVTNGADVETAMLESATPQIAPMLRFQTGERYQVHKSYIIMGPMAVFAVFVVVLLNSLNGLGEAFSALRQAGVEVPVLLVAIVVVLAIAVLYGIMLGVYTLAYKHLGYEFGEREFSLYSGILNRKQMHVPYARVQSVNHKAGVLQRIVGVCTVAIDTAGGSQNRAMRIPYVTLDTAEAIRTELFLRKALASANVTAGNVASLGGTVATGVACSAAAPTKAQAPVVAPNVLDSTVGDMADWRGLFGGDVAGLEPVSFELGLNNRELMFTSFSHDMPFMLALIMGLSSISFALPIALGLNLAAMLVVAFTIALVMLTAVVTWLLGAVGVAVSYGKFRVCRRGTRVEVERGLLQRSFSGIDVERVQSIEVRQTFIRRLMGYCELSLGRINSSSQDKANDEQKDQMHGLVIHPFVKVNQVEAILAELIPEFADRPAKDDLMPLPSVAKRRCLLRRCLWYNPASYAALAVLLFWVAWRRAIVLGLVNPAHAALGAMGFVTALVLVLCVATTAVLAIGAVLWARESRYAWNRGYVVIRNGGLRTTQVCVPRKKIQDGATRSNPFQRRLDLTSMTVTTAAGRKRDTTRLLDVPREAGDAWLTWMQPRTGMKRQ